MQTVREFAEANSGRRCNFKHSDFLGREGAYTGKVVGFYQSSFSLWILVEPDVAIGELASKVVGDSNFHWRENCKTYLLVDMDKIKLDPKEAVASSPYNGKCYCGQPAFIIFQFVECSSYTCKNYKKRYA